MNQNKKVITLVVALTVLVLAGSGAAYWYVQTPAGQEMLLSRQFTKVVTTNRKDNFRQALPTVLPKNRPAEFEFSYENRDDEADYAELVFIGPKESYLKISTGGVVKTTPFVLSDRAKDTLYEALFTIPFDQIRVNSLPLNLPNPNEILIGNLEKKITRQETLRVSFGQNQADRQNLVYVSGPSTEITDQSRPNWDIAKSLATKLLDTFRPKK